MTHNYEDHAHILCILCYSKCEGWAQHTGCDVQKMAWSFNALFDGNHPELDWNDNPMPPGSKHGPLADGFVACVWILIGEMT